MARRNVQTIDLGANHQMALKYAPRTIPCACRVPGRVADTTNLEEFHMDLVAKEPVPHREDGDDSARAGVQDQLPPSCRGLAPCRRR